jgi:hypothetical protein
VVALVNCHQTAGPHQVVWNGRDEGGRRAPAGAYFLRLRFEGESRVSRLVRIE